MRRMIVETLLDPDHPIWDMLATVVRLAAILVFVVVMTYATSNNYDMVWNDEGGHDLITWLALGGWSEWQRRRTP